MQKALLMMVVTAVALFALGHDFMGFADTAMNDAQYPTCGWISGLCDQSFRTTAYLYAYAAILILSLGGIATWLLLRSR